MKEFIIELFKKLGLSIGLFNQKKYDERKSYLQNKAIYLKYKLFTMIPEDHYLDNLIISNQIKNINGAIVECGVWRGGMIAGIAELIGNNRKYWLFDSFEGLPPANEIDGDKAIEWQNLKDGKYYFNNCMAEESFAEEAMTKANVTNKEIVKGWFKDTIPNSEIQEIALLRLDGDWYESTMVCLEAFYPKVVDGGIIILDDYYFWDGCSKAVHDYLSKNKIADRIHQSQNGVPYLVKNKKINHFITS